MKTRRTILCGMLAVMLALAFTACDDGLGGGGKSGGSKGKNGGGGDPTNWTAVADSTFGSDEFITGIAYGDGKFVAVGYESTVNIGGMNYISYEGKMAYSTDNGVTWTAVSEDDVYDSGFAAAAIRGITFGDGKFVAVGGSGTIAYSTDGIKWTKVTTSGFSSSAINAITYGGGKFVAVGDSQKTAHSTDGVTWTGVTIPDGIVIMQYADYTAIAYGGNKFVIGYGGLDVAYSTDVTKSTSWTAADRIPLKIEVIEDGDDVEVYEYQNWSNAIAYGGNKFVAGGQQGEMAYSTDGIKWTGILNGSFGTRAIIYGNNRFVAVGSRIAYSTNGTSWTAVADSPSGSAIAYGGNRFVIVGSGGKIAYSN